jgi:hypothetical protein
LSITPENDIHPGWRIHQKMRCIQAYASPQKMMHPGLRITPGDEMHPGLRITPENEMHPGWRINIRQDSTMHRQYS